MSEFLVRDPDALKPYALRDVEVTLKHGSVME